MTERTERFVLLHSSPSSISLATASDTPSFEDSPAISIPTTHPALAFAANIKRALKVAQAEQCLAEAIAIRNQQEAIFGAPGGLTCTRCADFDVDGSIKTTRLWKFVEVIHILAKAIEMKYEEALAESFEATRVVHKLVSDTIEHGSSEVLALLEKVLLQPHSVLQPLQLGKDGSSIDRLEVSFVQRQDLLHSLGRARNAYMEIRDAFSLLHKVAAVSYKQDETIKTSITTMQKEIALKVADVEKQLGSIDWASIEIVPGQREDGVNPQGTVEEIKSHETFVLSKTIVARNTELLKLASALKRREKALSMLLEASRTLKDTVREATAEVNQKASSLFQGMDDLEKGITTEGLVVTKEDVITHVLEVIDQSASLVDSNEVLKQARSQILQSVKSAYGSATLKKLTTSKKLFQLFIPRSNVPPVAFATHVVPFNGGPRDEKTFRFKFKPPGGDARTLTFFKTLDHVSQADYDTNEQQLTD
ncbi:hypothetical protein CF326_g1540 [Tilletia indica]|nr:hypothetical protein CF326_g1540 [Tilletia indica]